MAKTYRFDPDDDNGGFESRKQMKQERKRTKEERRRKVQEQERMDGGENNSPKPFDVMSTIDRSWSE